MREYYRNGSLRNGTRGMDWIYLAWDRDRQWALVNSVIKCPCSLKYGEFLVFVLLDSQKGLCFMDLFN